MTSIPTISREESEIREIEGDLQILQRRYANLDMAARRLRAGFYLLVAVLTTFILVAAIIGHWPALLLSTALLVVTILIVWTYVLFFPELRLIDYAGW